MILLPNNTIFFTLTCIQPCPLASLASSPPVLDYKLPTNFTARTWELEDPSYIWKIMEGASYSTIILGCLQPSLGKGIHTDEISRKKNRALSRDCNGTSFANRFILLVACVIHRYQNLDLTSCTSDDTPRLVMIDNYWKHIINAPRNTVKTCHCHMLSMLLPAVPCMRQNEYSSVVVL